MQESTIPSPNSAQTDATHLQVGGYFRGLMVHSILGEGAMGAAYLASHPVLQMPLVIKTFKGSVDTNIFREAHLAARVTSPNVVSVLDAGYESNTPFITQRYIDGIDLGELIEYLKQADWRLPVNLVCRLLLEKKKKARCGAADPSSGCSPGLTRAQWWRSSHASPIHATRRRAGAR